jgi:hypothetical protein
MLAIAALLTTVSEPRCMCVMLTIPYLMHELYAALYMYAGFADTSMLSSLLTSASTAGVAAYHIAVFVLASWYMYCGWVQRTISRHLGLLVAALMCVDYAAHCSTGSGDFCLLEYDDSLDAFYALAEGRQPWLVLFKAGGAAFAVAAAGLSCGFVLLCSVSKCMPAGRVLCSTAAHVLLVPRFAVVCQHSTGLQGAVVTLLRRCLTKSIECLYSLCSG